MTLLLSTVWFNKACKEDNLENLNQIESKKVNDALQLPCTPSNLNCFHFNDQCEFGQALVDQLNYYQQCTHPDHTGELNQYCHIFTKWFDYNDLRPFSGNEYYALTHFCKEIDCFNPSEPSSEMFYCNGFELHNHIYSGDILAMHGYATSVIEDNLPTCFLDQACTSYVKSVTFYLKPYLRECTGIDCFNCEVVFKVEYVCCCLPIYQ